MGNIPGAIRSLFFTQPGCMADQPEKLTTPPDIGYSMCVSFNLIQNPYDRLASDYDVVFGDDNHYYGPVNAREMEVLGDWIPESDGRDQVLDIGCGTGLHTSWLNHRGYRTVGIDISKEMIDRAREKSMTWPYPSRFLLQNALDAEGVERHGFTAVTCLGSTLNHLTDWAALAHYVSRALRPGGIFVFSYDNVIGLDVIGRWLLRVHDGYSDDYFREVVTARLFSLVRGVCYRNHWIPHCADGPIEIRLVYESTGRWRRFMKSAGLQVKDLRGVHILTAFDPMALKTSAGSQPGSGRSRQTRRLLMRLDWQLSRRLPCVAANIVGTARKPD